MRISAKNHVFSMDRKAEPACKVSLPARLTFETLDCFAGQVKSEKDTIETLDFDHVNPATGPIYFNDISTGDVIKVHISDIRFQSTGVMVAAPEAGVLGDLITESQTIIVPVRDKTVEILGQELPHRPMIGVIGLAPEGEAIACGTPGSHGGNMDNTLISTGCTLYLPVQVEGGLLAMGDLHVAMGDGEIMVSGVEAAGEVDVTVEKAIGLEMKNPLIVTPELVATVASAQTLDLAVEMATKDMAKLLQKHAGMSLNEAGMLMSACGDAQICQIVDPYKTGRFCMSRNLMKKLGVALAF